MFGIEGGGLLGSETRILSVKCFARRFALSRADCAIVPGGEEWCSPRRTLLLLNKTPPAFGPHLATPQLPLEICHPLIRSPILSIPHMTSYVHHSSESVPPHYSNGEEGPLVGAGARPWRLQEEVVAEYRSHIALSSPPGNSQVC
ncbi:hypothetical protein E2C01_016052 [Portunus trituberculatus]|uniref:Uncharacterized protein n=1 Tax=Portunus trituberculatus TaxID=210409 RepID=A0A5B7DPI5_PORTR|nr:hypothetical protein [Portunus trituberculatus]